METNTATKTDAAASYTGMMAARDGAASLWVDGQHRFAKLVRDGATLARIDRLTDGTFVTYSAGVRTTVASWEAASAWLTARATAESIVSDLVIFTAERS